MKTSPPPEPVIRTVPDLPQTVIAQRTQFGAGLTNEAWHRLEADRWARSGRFAFVRANGGGRIHIAEGYPRPGIDHVCYLPQGGAK